MTSQFMEESFEDRLVDAIKELDINIGTRNLHVNLIEGTGFALDSPADMLEYDYKPACLLGIRGVTETEIADGQSKSYKMTFELVVWISALDRTRKAGEFSDNRNIRRSIRKEIYGKNPYKEGNSLLILTLQSDDYIATTDKVSIYEQIYTGTYFEHA